MELCSFLLATNGAIFITQTTSCTLLHHANIFLNILLHHSIGLCLTREYVAQKVGFAGAMVRASGQMKCCDHEFEPHSGRDFVETSLSVKRLPKLSFIVPKYFNRSGIL